MSKSYGSVWCREHQEYDRCTSPAPHPTPATCDAQYDGFEACVLPPDHEGYHSLVRPTPATEAEKAHDRIGDELRSRGINESDIAITQMGYSRGWSECYAAAEARVERVAAERDALRHMIKRIGQEIDAALQRGRG